MVDLRDLPREVLDLIIEQLLITIGIQKAVLLRTVSRLFSECIEQAICYAQVVDVDDCATPGLKRRMPRRLRGKIFEVQSRCAGKKSKGYLQAIALVNSALDKFYVSEDPTVAVTRHQFIAQAVLCNDDMYSEQEHYFRDVLRGAAAIGCVDTVSSIQHNSGHAAIAPYMHKSTPFFPSALTLAAAAGHLEMVRYLLDNSVSLEDDLDPEPYRRLVVQADWNDRDEHMRSAILRESPLSALRSSVSGGHRDILQLFLLPQHRLPINSLEYLRAIWDGAKSGRLDMIETLLKFIQKDLSDFEGLGKELLLVAVRYKHKLVVEWLLGRGVDVNAFRDERQSESLGAMHIAASLGLEDMVRFLLRQGADFNLNPSYCDADGGFMRPIDSAARCGQEDIVDLFLDLGADPITVLRQAARFGHPRLLKSILERYPTLLLEEEGQLGFDALLYAIACGNLTSMTILAEAGVPLNACSGGHPNNLPLNVARRHCGAWLTRHLISLGAQDIEDEPQVHHSENTARGIVVSPRTWEWVGKY